MNVTIGVSPADAQLFVRYLNGDNGMREQVVLQLLQQNRPDGQAQMTAVVGVFGRISRGFMEALEEHSLLDRASREREIRTLAGLD